MRWIAALVVLFQLVVWPVAAVAQDSGYSGYALRTVSTTSWVEEWDEAQQRWVPVADQAVRSSPKAENAVVRATVRAGESPRTQITNRTYQAARYAVPFAPPGPPRTPVAIAHYGPFVVLSGDRAAVIGSTDSASPHHFDAMLRDFPGLRVLEMIEAPGTSNDIANLAVGRRIREAGLTTHVPRGGSVRSGAVELFLAGAQRRVDDGAQFAVHSWLDNYGRQPADFAADAPENRLYLDYYVEMGMTEAQAHSFYAMTNSVPHTSAKWLDAQDMLAWIAPDRARQRHMDHAGTPDPFSPADLRSYPKANWFIAAAQAGPIPLPELRLGSRAGLAMAHIVPISPSAKFAQPNIAYGDIAALTLADARDDFASSRRYAFLDS